MPIDTRCRWCDSKIRAPKKLAGKKTKCPKCGASITIPGDREIPIKRLVDTTIELPSETEDLITFSCTLCEERYEVDACLEGKTISCRKCGELELVSCTVTEYHSAENSSPPDLRKIPAIENESRTRKLLPVLAVLLGLSVSTALYFYTHRPNNETNEAILRELQWQREQVQRKEKQLKQQKIEAQEAENLARLKDAKIKRIARLLAKYQDKRQADLHALLQHNAILQGIVDGQVTPYRIYIPKEEELYTSYLPDMREKYASYDLADLQIPAQLAQPYRLRPAAAKKL